MHKRDAFKPGDKVKVKGLTYSYKGICVAGFSGEVVTFPHGNEKTGNFICLIAWDPYSVYLQDQEYRDACDAVGSAYNYSNVDVDYLMIDEGCPDE